MVSGTLRRAARQLGVVSRELSGAALRGDWDLPRIGPALSPTERSTQMNAPFNPSEARFSPIHSGRCFRARGPRHNRFAGFWRQK